MSGRFGPVPDWWMADGAPAQAVAALAEGACPVHEVMLAAGTIRLGGRPGRPEVRQPAGWCEACACWWHSSPDGAMVATWHRDGGQAAASGDGTFTFSKRPES